MMHREKSLLQVIFRLSQNNEKEAELLHEWGLCSACEFLIRMDYKLDSTLLSSTNTTKCNLAFNQILKYD